MAKGLLPLLCGWWMGVDRKIFEVWSFYKALIKPGNDEQVIGMLSRAGLTEDAKIRIIGLLGLEKPRVMQELKDIYGISVERSETEVIQNNNTEIKKKKKRGKKGF